VLEFLPMNLSILHQVIKDEPKFRHSQIEQAVFVDLISNWDQATVLPKSLREKLNIECPLDIPAEIIKTSGRKESTFKALIKLEDGKEIEAVLIRQPGARNTVCVSSQVGCPLHCAFCATGQLGFSRNLKAHEIVEQVLLFMRELKNEGGEEKIDNIVFMGMGEPFLNYVEVIKALKWLNDPESFNFGARRLSVSTAGITEGIRKIGGEKIQVNLAISLHFATDLSRRRYMPIAEKYPLEKLMSAASEYVRKSGRKVMFEYLLIKDINDSENDAKLLAALMTDPLYMVNLIPYNPTGRFQASPEERILSFQKTLENLGVNVTRRRSYGSDISAACGQLAAARKK
jgi:23S rRNA (adenine2503-C2)-methyltransferase